MDLAATTPRFEKIHQTVIVEDIKRQLSPLFRGTPLSEDDLSYALTVASRLAFALDGRSASGISAAKKAYDVATRTLWMGNGSGPTLRKASELILTRLGNFPGQTLLRDRFTVGSSFISDLEILARRFENRSDSSKDSKVLTDFQVRLLEALETKKWVSVSAPTSAGKSFTLELEIARQLRGTADYQAVYLVPTRALIRQVTYDLVQLVRGTEFQSVPILSVPSPPEKNGSGRKMIYVLTQERLANLLAVGGETLKLNALIVDEAQEIAEQGRGQTLEAVIGNSLARFPDAKVFFSSPLKSNPEYLLTVFSATQDNESFVEQITPVTQNIVNVFPLKGNPRKARFELWLDGQSIEIGIAELSFKFRPPHLHRFAISLTESGDSSIIYCNLPSTADKMAARLAEELLDEEDGDPKIGELVDFLRNHIHKQYRLADALEKRVAFHYGNIPQVIRGRVEDLLRDRVLRYVCCTSTLLQGMNLPAKNIFIENPKKGLGRPMLPSDFWNLVGRAGRMSKEFAGNVYCVHGTKWESEPLKVSRLDSITSAFRVAVTQRATELARVATTPPPSSESETWAEQAAARIYRQFTMNGKNITDSEFVDKANIASLHEVDTAMLSVRKSQRLPALIYEQNLYFHPARLEELAQRFRSDGPVTWIPLNPRSRNSYAQLNRCFALLEEVFLRTGTETHKYDAFMAIQWMQGKSLKELIQDKIKWQEIGGDSDAINDAIRELFGEIENRLRYKYVKYMRVFAEVLRAVLIEAKQVDYADRIPPIHLYLEYGASSLTLINFIALGLSRTSAILLQRARNVGDELSSMACQQVIETIDLASAALPAICATEITRLRRRN